MDILAPGFKLQIHGANRWLKKSATNNRMVQRLRGLGGGGRQRTQKDRLAIGVRLRIC